MNAQNPLHRDTIRRALAIEIARVTRLLDTYAQPGVVHDAMIKTTLEQALARAKEAERADDIIPAFNALHELGQYA